jgi:hypothetical protein
MFSNPDIIKGILREPHCGHPWYVASNDRVSEWWIGKDLEESGRGLILSTISAFGWETEENQ